MDHPRGRIGEPAGRYLVGTVHFAVWICSMIGQKADLSSNPIYTSPNGALKHKLLVGPWIPGNEEINRFFTSMAII